MEFGCPLALATVQVDAGSLVHLHIICIQRASLSGAFPLLADYMVVGEGSRLDLGGGGEDTELWVLGRPWAADSGLGPG